MPNSNVSSMGQLCIEQRKCHKKVTKKIMLQNRTEVVICTNTGVSKAKCQFQTRIHQHSTLRSSV